MPDARYALADFGSYTAGGRIVRVSGEPLQEHQFTRTTRYLHDPHGELAIEHAYVQYFVPAVRTIAPPVVLLHGGGMSGAMWETTPDGRPGWLHGLLAAGAEVHVVDNVERGRAGWCSLPNIWPSEPIMRTLEETWTRFRFGDVDGQGRRKVFPGQRFPIAAIAPFLRSFVPRWTTLGSQAADALTAVLRRVGPAILVCHSQGGEPAMLAAVAVPHLVEAIVAVEPTGFADPASMANIPMLLVNGDYRDRSDHWRGIAARTDLFVAEARRRGAAIDVMDCPALDMVGNSHMLMMDSNNLAVLNGVLQWLTNPNSWNTNPA